VIAVAHPATGLQIGLALTAVALGFRHGIDWDHIAALTDITGSQDSSRQSMVLATMYAFGHALVVFVLGVGAIALSAEIPQWLDDTMSRVVGVTLVVLGVYLLVSLVRQRRDFRMRSRWMIVFAGARRASRWIRSRRTPATEPLVITHDHDHPHSAGHDHTHESLSSDAGTNVVVHVTTAVHHHHVHHHIGTLPEDPFPSYGRPTAFAVGALHGVGAETPTQILLFLAAARAGGTAIGVALLLCFIIGLLASNSVVAMTTLFGFRGASRNFPLYVAISLLAGIFSLVVGTLFLLGMSPLLPALAG
jgi:high-affinity nickel permease